MSKSDWIPCSERLPERTQAVLVYDRVQGVTCGSYQGPIGWYDLAQWPIHYPTHWMPLPSGPSDG